MDYFGVFVSFINFTFSFKYFLLARLVPLAYTIKKLQITCVVEDDKVIFENNLLIDIFIKNV
jgi:hypothetical protein